MAIKDMQTLLEEGHIAGPLDGSELLLIEQGGFSKVLTVEALYQYLSGRCGCSGGGVDCTPTTASITGAPEDETAPGGLTVNDTVSATYSYNGSPAKTITFSGSSPKYAMLMDLAGSINFDAGFDLIHFEGMSGATPFAIVGVAGAYDSISGGDGSTTAAPADLVLSLTPGADHDAVAILFGEAITVHSCGPQDWSGI